MIPFLKERYRQRTSSVYSHIHKQSLKFDITIYNNIKRNTNKSLLQREKGDREAVDEVLKKAGENF